MEIIIINDGSTDDTKAVGKKFAAKSKRVKLISQANAGKAMALNNGIRKSKGEIIICVDDDTLFPRYTVTRLIKHFSDPSVGAVAGSVKVGNISNVVTRWQALEYTVSIHLERSAQGLLELGDDRAWCMWRMAQRSHNKSWWLLAQHACRRLRPDVVNP